MTPRRTDEYLIGTNKQFSHGVTGRLYYRHRYGSHYWEDTNNNARVAFAPPPGIPQTLYIPNLTAMTTQIGSGSSYVIAELDGSYTSYHEVTIELEWRTRKSYVRLVLHVDALPRQLRPGQHVDVQRLQHLHRIVEHRRRCRPPAVESSRTARSRATSR